MCIRDRDKGKNVEMTDDLASDIFKKDVAETQVRTKDNNVALADNDIETVHYLSLIHIQMLS